MRPGRERGPVEMFISSGVPPHRTSRGDPMKSEIETVDAIWVHIRNIKKARVFYRDVLGLKELSASDEEEYGIYQIPRGPKLGIHKQGKNEPGRKAGTVSGVYFK